MMAEELIQNDITPLTRNDSVLKALDLMEEYKIMHLPVVEKGEYLGIISEEDLLEATDIDMPVSKLKPAMIRPFTRPYKHVYDALKIFSEHHLTLLPVLNKENKYEGYISLVDLGVSFSRMASLNELGGILILEVNQNDYSLAEIASIVESNDAKILSSYITSHTDSTKVEVTLKINVADLSRIIQTFTRYEYIILASYHESEHGDDYKDRFDSFMNYLNI